MKDKIKRTLVYRKWSDDKTYRVALPTRLHYWYYDFKAYLNLIILDRIEFEGLEGHKVREIDSILCGTLTESLLFFGSRIAAILILPIFGVYAFSYLVSQGVSFETGIGIIAILPAVLATYHMWKNTRK